MSAFLHLWRRELESCFRTSIAYITGVAFLVITGLGLWLAVARLAQGGADGNMAELLFGSVGYWLAMLTVTPLLTMRLFAEEYRMGTLEMLLTAPVTETEVVLAKFAGVWVPFLLLWAPTLLYVPILRGCGAQLPPTDWGPMASGYLGTALIGAFFLSVGLACSLLTRHQAVAAMTCLTVLGVLLSGGFHPEHAHPAAIRRLAQLFSAPLHIRDFAAGLIDTRTVVWYASSTVLLLFLSIRILEARRLR